MAASTEAIVYWTRISVALGVTGAGAIVWTLVETRKMTATTREVARDQSRAYLHIEKAEILYIGRLGLQIESGIFPAFDMKFYIKNTGQTPARWYKFEIVSRVSEVREEARETISEIVIPPKRWGFVSSGDVQTVGTNSLEVLEQIRLACENSKRSIHITGILRYETEFGEERTAPYSFFRQGADIQWYTLPIVDEDEKRKQPITMFRTRQSQG